MTPQQSLTLTVAGRDIVVGPPSARIGRAQIAAFTISMARRKKEEPPAAAVDLYEARYGSNEHDFERDALGADLCEQLLDELTLEQYVAVAAGAHLWIATGSQKAAQHVVDTLLEVPDDTEGGSQADPKGGTSGAGATTTKRQAPGTGSKSRKKNTTST